MKLLLFIFAAWCITATHAIADVALEKTIIHNDTQRHYYLYQPQNLPKGAPLVFALHGMGGNAANMRYGLGLNARADQYGFGVVYPQGIRLKQGSRHWNAGFHFSHVDDLGFLSNLAATLQRDFGFDPDRTFAMGISMGGFMAYSLACHKDSGFSAIVSVIGTMSQQDWKNCDPPRNMSIMHIHGERDHVVPISGHRGFLSAAPNVPAVIDFWAQNIDAEFHQTTDVTPVYALNKYQNTHTGAEVDYLVLKDFGHDWPHMENARFSTVDVVAKFFDQIARQKAGAKTQ